MKRAAMDHVLSRFHAGERKLLEQALDAAADAIEEWARDGPARAANKWNAWAPTAGAGPTTDGPPGTSGVQPTTHEQRAADPAAEPDAHGIVRRRTGWRKLLDWKDRP
jgi:hypothetical protein